MIEDAFGAIVSIPVWSLVAFVLSGTIIGMSFLLLAIMVLGKVQLPRKERPLDAVEKRESAVAGIIMPPVKSASEPEPVKVKAPKEDKRVKSRKKQKKVPEPVVIRLSPDDRAELERRAARRKSYSFAEAVELLGVTEKEAMVWVYKGDLKTMVIERDRFVTPKAILELVDRIGAKVVVVENDGDGGKDGDDSDSEDEFGAAQEPVADSVSLIVDVKPARKSSLPIRQFYWYSVKGVEGRFATLKEVLAAAGTPLPDDAKPAWKNVPSEVRKRIVREKV